MSNSAFHWSTSSCSLAIAVISISCVFAIPLFPKGRNTNDSQRLMGILSYLISSAFLSYETKIFSKIQTLGFLFWKFCLRITRRSYEQYVDVAFPNIEHNLLAYFFFLGYFLVQVWNIANEVYFAIEKPECYNELSLLANGAKLTLGILLIVAIIFKDSSTKDSKLSWFGWSFVGAVCFSSAFKYVIEEVIWGYIDIVEKSIADPEYGLNTTNYTSAEEYLDPIFKFKAHCIHYVIFEGYAEPILELIPFSTEYFSLATCFCVVTWKNLDSSKATAHHAPNPAQNPNPNPDEHHRCTDTCFFSIRQLPAIITVICLVSATAVSIYAFNVKMHAHKYLDAVWIFIGQQLSFQTILFFSEGIFYMRHLRHMKSENDPPNHFQLDIMLLIFPLFPLGILFVLRVLPDIIQQSGVKNNFLTTSELLWSFLNVFLALWNWCQVAFQAIFLSQIFCCVKSTSLKGPKFFFLILAGLNFCIWLSWTMECKAITIHGRSFMIYGVVEWIVIVYATVPFALFCFAHTTACFLEIMGMICPDAPLNTP